MYARASARTWLYWASVLACLGSLTWWGGCAGGLCWQTVYYANVLKKDVGESLGILSEMLLQSTFDPAAIEREKRTILQEMEEVEKVEEEVVFDNLHYTAFQTSPLGRTILGTEENIKNMTRDLIVNYIQVPPACAPPRCPLPSPSSSCRLPCSLLLLFRSGAVCRVFVEKSELWRGVRVV